MKANFKVTTRADAKVTMTIKAAHDNGTHTHQSFDLGPYTDDENKRDVKRARWFAKQLRKALACLRDSKNEA